MICLLVQQEGWENTNPASPLEKEVEKILPGSQHPSSILLQVRPLLEWIMTQRSREPWKWGQQEI